MDRNFIEIITEIIFWILLIILAYQLLLKISGHGPTDFALLYTGFGAIMTYLLTLSYKLGSFVGRVEEFMKNTKESFNRLREDIAKKRF